MAGNFIELLECSSSSELLDDDVAFSEEELDFSCELEVSIDVSSSCFGPDDESSPQAIKEHAEIRQKENRIRFMGPPLVW